jgi:mRNA-degrading endonuclease RelE of RelBE toxin-antitoxin system
MPYEVVITESAKLMLKDLKRHGKGTLEQLKRVIMGLATNPEGQTTELRAELKGFRSLHVGRFRIIIKIVEHEVKVYVVGVGWHESGDRDDVYQLVSALIKRGRITLSSTE